MGGIMGAVKRLFGGGAASAAGEVAAEEGGAVEHNGYRIIPRPTRQGGQFLTSGLIVRDGPDGGRREHRFVRADTHASEDEAREFTIAKARRLIDEQGEGLFQP